jgi:hypothetical protein
VNVKDIRYLVILLGVLMVVLGGKYTEVMEIIINLICHILNIEKAPKCIILPQRHKGTKTQKNTNNI